MTADQKTPHFPPSGVIKQADGTFVTKHDKFVSGRSNTRKVMEVLLYPHLFCEAEVGQSEGLQFPPGFQTGDAMGDDVILSNKVYNALKRHSQTEGSRRLKLREKKDTSTAELAVDAKTRLILFKASLSSSCFCSQTQPSSELD